MEYTRITLRLPTDLHEEILASANAKSSSMNAEIIYRLRFPELHKFVVSEKINDLGGNDRLTEGQREEVEELIQQALKNAGVLEK